MKSVLQLFILANTLTALTAAPFGSNVDDILHAYRTNEQPLEEEILNVLSNASALLGEGNELVLTGEQTQKMLADKTNEHNQLAKAAYDRLKRFERKGGSSTAGSRHRSSNPYRSGKSSGSSPYSGYPSSYGNNYGRSSYGNYDYDDDYGSSNHQASTTPATKTTPSTQSDGVDLKAAQEAAQQKHERERQVKDVVKATQDIIDALAGVPTDSLDAALQELANGGQLTTLQQASNTYFAALKREQDTKTAVEAEKQSTGHQQRPRPGAFMERKQQKQGEALVVVDSRVKSSFQVLLPNLIHAATMDDGIAMAGSIVRSLADSGCLPKATVAGAVSQRAEKVFAD